MTTNAEPTRVVVVGAGIAGLVPARTLSDHGHEAQRAAEEFGRVDGIANCIGSLLLKPAHLTTEAEWQATMHANVTSAFAAVRAGARVMAKGGYHERCHHAAGSGGVPTLEIRELIAIDHGEQWVVDDLHVPDHAGHGHGGGDLKSENWIMHEGTPLG